MRKTKLRIFMIIVLVGITSFIGLFLLKIDTVVVLGKEQIFTYSQGQSQLIDINNDNIPDFKCIKASRESFPSAYRSFR